MVQPNSWLQTTISDVCEINPTGSAMGLSRDDPVSFVPMSAVDDKNGEITTFVDRPLFEVAKGYTSFSENDVLFAKITPCMENGKAAIARGLTNRVGFGSTEFHVLRCRDAVLPEYIFHFIRQPRFRDIAKRFFTGSGGQQRVPADFFQRIKLPLPPIQEQERIVAILKKADALHRMRRALLERSKAIGSTLFLEMFGDPSLNANGHKRQRLDQLGELERGVSKHRPRDAAFLFSGQYPFIQTGDVSNSGGWITNYSQTYSDEGLKQSRLWPKGTLCITIAANIAKTGILTFDACFPDSVVGFVPADGMTTEYAMFFLNSVQKRLEENAPQAAQKNINLKVLRNLLVPVPPRQDIALFSARVQRLRLHLSLLSSNAMQIEDVLSELRLRAFHGELTRAWRLATGTEDKGKKPAGRLSINITETAAAERPWQCQTHRQWLANQISEFQGSVRLALQEWKGTFVPTEDMENFARSWPIGDLAGHEDHIKRALNELAGLGLIARLSIPNESGDYVTAYRGLREDELSRVDDLDAIKRALGDD